MDRPHSRKIDDKAVVTQSAAADIVTATAYRCQQTAFASEVDGIHNIRDACASGDQLRPFIDTGIPDFAGSVVFSVLR
jgi:hypothetical protein